MLATFEAEIALYRKVFSST